MRTIPGFFLGMSMQPKNGTYIAMAIAYNTSMVRSGLVMHLDAANRKSYPGSGATWFDLSGNNNHGAMTSVTFDSSNNGSLFFDNSNDTISINHASNLNFNSNFTVSSWIRINSFSTSFIYNVIAKKPSFNNTQKGWSCQYDFRTNGILQYRNNNGTVLNDQTPTAGVNNTVIFNQTERWVNSVWVITTSTVSFYINGMFNSTQNIQFSDTDTGTPIYIGKVTGSVGDPSPFMNLSSIAVHNRSLSSIEITQNFEAIRGRYGI